MTPGARIAAAIEVLTEVFSNRAAADRTLGDWARANRFAGSKDRKVIEEYVYKALRRRNEAMHRMRTDAPRALMLGALALEGLGAGDLEGLVTDGPYAPGALSAAERQAIERPPAKPQDPWIRLNYPEWLHGELQRGLGSALELEMLAALERAPMDLRVNTLKADRETARQVLAAEGVETRICRFAGHGLRVESASSAKPDKTDAYRFGLIEIQDAGSQIVSTLSGVSPGQRVVDLCAGGGGKALAMASLMGNRGRLIACDVDARRLGRVAPRAVRAGATVIELTGDPYAEHQALAAGTADLVCIDAPCSGSGTWRRNPESKWTLDPLRLETYREAQSSCLDRAAALVRPGGKILFVTCSLLPSEGEDQIKAFLGRTDGFAVQRADDVWTELGAQEVPTGLSDLARLTVSGDGTDGFFAAILRRQV